MALGQDGVAIDARFVLDVPSKMPSERNRLIGVLAWAVWSWVMAGVQFRGELVEAAGGVVVDALEEVGEVGLGSRPDILAVSMRVMARARVSPPVSEPAKSRWLASDADGVHGALGRVRRGIGPPDRSLTLLTVDGHAAVLEE